MALQRDIFRMLVGMACLLFVRKVRSKMMVVRSNDMRDDLYKELQRATMDQITEYNMFPSRSEICANLNQYSPLLGAQLGGIELVFI